ncbi:MAG TPA: SpvB/TcaC N-terminal domain-containing protein, partial [Gammaproteobacteria bacterium]
MLPALLGRSCTRRLLSSALILAILTIPRFASSAVLPGAVPGNFGVGDQGNATYTIPIAAPAATGGLKPNLALSYNHLAGNGLAGMRWNLRGISAITRCPQTYAQDGAVYGINYTSTDRFCLDGQRLVNFSGTYGAHLTEYRTELETFQKIVQESTQGSGPMYFRVDHGNGLRSYYGYTADSRMEASNGSSVRTWYISYTEDQFQNRISYTYSENTSTGETVPTEVSWTSNAAQGLAARYTVVITYETRPAEDQRTGYDAGGALWSNTKRIDKIDVIYNTT